ncbi:MAG: M23 family metallopeptidase [Myxococcota bacterium]
MRAGLGLCLLMTLTAAALAPRAAARPPTVGELATLVVPEPVAPAPRTPQTDIRRLLRPEESILAARDRLDQDIERRQAELVKARELEAALDADLQRQTAHVEAMTADLDTARAAVRARIAALDRLRRVSGLARTLGQASWGDADLARAAADRLTVDDYARVFVYELRLTMWRMAEADRARRARNLERTRQAIGYVEQELAWDQEERQALEAAVVKEPEFYAAYAQEMEKLDPEIAAKVESLTAAAPKDRPRMYFEETRGGLAVPIRNPDLVGGFGARIYLGVRSTWHGLHMVPMRPPKDGERVDIRAIYWGWVAWTGWIQGLGKVVVLDHTMGYTTLYAHLASIDVKVGDKVKTGTPLGAMGATESFFGARLYLELRKDGVALDPLPWMR